VFLAALDEADLACADDDQVWPRPRQGKRDGTLWLGGRAARGRRMIVLPARLFDIGAL